MKTKSLFSLGLALAGFVPAFLHATEIYQTDFSNFPYVQNGEWVGKDGWMGLGTSNTNDDRIIAVDGGGIELGGLLGLDNANQEPLISVFREIVHDPMASTKPVVVIKTAIGFQTSDNGNDDFFAISFFNRNTDELAGLGIDASNLELSRQDGLNFADLGISLPTGGFVDLEIRIDFVANLWSLIMNGTSIFKNETFSAPSAGLTRDLGRIAFDWVPTDPANSGNNYLVVNFLQVDVFPNPDLQPTISTRKKITTRSKRVRLRGSASDDDGVASIAIKAKGKPFRQVAGTTRWRFVSRIKAKRSRYVVRATDTAGQLSKPVAVVVKRR